LGELSYYLLGMNEVTQKFQSGYQVSWQRLQQDTSAKISGVLIKIKTRYFTNSWDNWCLARIQIRHLEEYQSVPVIYNTTAM
jgi:hypothetical protein